MIKISVDNLPTEGDADRYSIFVEFNGIAELARTVKIANPHTFEAVTTAVGKEIIEIGKKFQYEMER